MDCNTEIQSLHTRFIFTFFIDRYTVHEVAEALTAATAPAPAGGHGGALWEDGHATGLYTSELLPHVGRFLFEDATACRYLRVPPAVANQWFDGAVATIRGGAQVPARLASTGIELFLSDDGAGLLSIPLVPRTTPLAIDTAFDFNYGLAQLSTYGAAVLRRGHPADDPARLVALSNEQRAGLKPAPADNAPLGERLGHAGGSFKLPELVDAVLLGAIKGKMERGQSQLSVYTVARYDKTVDLGDSGVHAALLPHLSGLAQIEESSHAGAASGHPWVKNEVLNRRHWTAVGLMGVAHIVADQGDDHPYDDQRVPRVFNKYFIPYVVAQLQSLSVQKMLREVSLSVAADGNLTVGELAALRAHLLKFSMEGHFTRVSQREALHRYYQLCRAGLDVDSMMSEVRLAITDIDAKHTSDAQTRNLSTMAHLQVSVEYIEIFVVSVYSAHLWDMVASEQPALREYQTAGVIVAALLAAVVTTLWLRPWETTRSLRDRAPLPPPHGSRDRTTGA